MSDGGADGHSSSSSARWRRSSSHQPLASAGCELAGGVVRWGNFDALHVGRILAGMKNTDQQDCGFMLNFHMGIPKGKNQVKRKRQTWTFAPVTTDHIGFVIWQPCHLLLILPIVPECQASLLYFLSLPPLFAESF
jgi:hypothetical protein